MKTTILALIATLAAPAFADEVERNDEVTPEKPAKAEPHRFYARAGALHMHPFANSSPLVLSGVKGPASLAIMDGPVVGSGTALDAITMPAVIVGYRFKSWGGRFSMETVLGPPVKATFRATGTLASESIAPMALGGISTGVDALGPKLGEAELLPPVGTLIYRLLDGERFQPYIGLGWSVMIATRTKTTNEKLTEVAEPRMTIDPAFGAVVQAGFDIGIYKALRARIDVKYIAFMKAHATVENIRIRTPDLPIYDNVAVGTASMDVEVNPLIIQAGLGIDFW